MPSADWSLKTSAGRPKPNLSLTLGPVTVGGGMLNVGWRREVGDLLFSNLSPSLSLSFTFYLLSLEARSFIVFILSLLCLQFHCALLISLTRFL